MSLAVIPCNTDDIWWVNPDITEINEYPKPEGQFPVQDLPKSLLENVTPDLRSIALINYIDEGGVDGDTRIFGPLREVKIPDIDIPEQFALADPDSAESNQQWIITYHKPHDVYSIRLQAYPDDIATDLYFGIYDYAGSIITILTHLLQFGIEFDNSEGQIMYKIEE